jgi:glycosyltransferase involved in cell wall biosynthesis
MPRRERVGFLSTSGPTDPRACSGTIFSIAQVLERQGNEIVWLGPVRSASVALGKIVDKAYHAATRKRYDFKNSAAALAEYGVRFGLSTRQRKPDWIVAPFASAELAALSTDVPVVYTSDSTYRLMRDYYPLFNSYINKHDGERAERLAIRKADVCTYPSRWAADSAIEDYGADPARVAVIPYGANLEVPERGEVRYKTFGDACRLLFVGLDWERKGGDIAIETLARLRGQRIGATLTIVGCVPPEASRSEAITVIPFLDKRDREGSARLRELYAAAHVLLFPTRADAYGIVVPEANAHGVPAIATETGGVPGAVRDGRNGYLLPLSARGDAYAQIVAALYADPARYARLAVSSRDYYDEVLNWDVWARAVRHRVGVILSEAP